jgi:hypothetical protein
MRMVSNCERPWQIDTVLGGGLVEKIRIGLAARAAIRALVGTHIDRRDGHALFAKMREDPRVHLAHIVQSDYAPSHPRLVRDEEQEEVLLKLPECLDGMGIECHFRRLSQVPAILNQSSISVQKDRRAKWNRL